jgi:hypothetical protein
MNEKIFTASIQVTRKSKKTGWLPLPWAMEHTFLLNFIKLWIKSKADLKKATEQGCAKHHQIKVSLQTAIVYNNGQIEQLARVIIWLCQEMRCHDWLQGSITFLYIADDCLESVLLMLLLCYQLHNYK